MLTPKLHKSVGLPVVFSLQYTIIAIKTVKVGYNLILMLYTYYGAKPEGATRRKAITVYAPANRIRAQMDRYWGSWEKNDFAGAIITYDIFIHILNYLLDKPKHLLC